jgi:hypothetical protein
VTLIIWLLFGVGIPVVLLTYLFYLRGRIVAVAPSEQSGETTVTANGGLLPGWASRDGVNSDLIWIIAYTVISSIFYALLVQSYDGSTHDLSYFVWPPLVVSLQIAIAGRFARIFVPRPWNKYAYHLLNGAAVTYFVYAMLGQAEGIKDSLTYFFFSRGNSSADNTMRFVVDGIAQKRLYFALGIGAITVYRAVPFLHEIGSSLSRWRAAALAVSLGLAGWGLYVIFDSFSPVWSGMPYVGWVIFAGLIAMALGALAYYGTKLEDALVSEVCLWLSSSKLRLFIIGVAIASYIHFLRPLLHDAGAAWGAALIEWGTFCFVVWRMYDGIRGRISDTYSVHLKYTSWKRHIQQVQKQVDGDFSYANNVQMDFVERSHKDQLLVFLVTLMHDNGMAVEEISEVLHPLADHQDESIPVFSFTKTRNLIRKRNKENRDQILKDIMAALRERDIQTG